MYQWFLLFSLLFSSHVFAKSELPQTNTEPLPRTVALTFDDGPSPVYTPQILAILKKENIKATFFVVGSNAKQYPDLIKAIHDDGHVVASHSQTHPMLTRISDKTLQYEVNEPSKIITQILGSPPKCLRYPFGASNEHVRQTIRDADMHPVPMGFNSFDYMRPGAKKIVDQILNHLYPREVILMHDGYDKREQTVAALPDIIKGIRAKSLGFSTICG